MTDHPGPYMAQNIAEWFAKGKQSSPQNPHLNLTSSSESSPHHHLVLTSGGSHHNYYMWYGGNHIESWAASGLTNQYGDGSNMYSDTLPNEPKKSHLAEMHVALAAMNDALLGDTIQTRNSAVSVAPCVADPEATSPGWHAYGKDICVNGRNVSTHTKQSEQLRPVAHGSQLACDCRAPAW